MHFLYVMLLCYVYCFKLKNRQQRCSVSHRALIATNCSKYSGDVKLYNLIYLLRRRAGGAYLSPHNGSSEGQAKHLIELLREPRPGQQAAGHLREQATITLQSRLPRVTL